MAIIDKVTLAIASTTHGNVELARDDDWGTRCGQFSGGSGSRGWRQTTKFEWAQPTTITSVEFRCYVEGSIACNCDGGGASAWYNVFLKVEGGDYADGILLASDAKSGPACSSNIVDSGRKIIEGPWDKITGIRFVMNAAADCKQSATAFTYLYEVHCYAQTGGYIIVI